LRAGEILPDPDFSLLRESSPYLIGVRTHRRGGVRLELAEAPIETPAGKKYVIHDYGHGGAGITLSWGCASIVVDLAEQALAKLATAKQTARVAVLGTGVAGLTAATELRRRWPALPLAVYAQDLDVRTTTSFIAGGQFEPSGIFHEYEGDERKRLFGSYLRRSRDRIVELQRSPQRLLFGVAERKDYTLDHENRALDVFTPADVIAPYRKGLLPFEKLRIVGREYTTWLMNPTLLLPKLRGDLEAAGVPFRQRHFGGLEDVAALEENLIVNCTGLGSKKLFSDENLVPQRGHLVVLKKTDPKQFYFFSGGCTNPVICYVFCRQEDIVVGGTVQSGNDSSARDVADDSVFQRLLENARQVFGGHPAACLS
jgi:glycine/D-amino acid oxidase-like deaminating enzyme